MRFCKLLFVSVLLFPFALFAQDESPCEPTTGRKALRIYKKAMDELAKGNRIAASSILAEAVEEDPEYYEAYYLRAYINVMPTNPSRNPAIAIQGFLRVYEICPAYENYYSSYYLGQFFYSSEKWDEAEKHLDFFYKNAQAYEPQSDSRADERRAERDNQRLEKDMAEVAEMLVWARFYKNIINDPKPFIPKIVKGISSKDDEYLVIISPDNELAFYTRRVEVPPPPSGFTRSGVSYRENFMISERINSEFDSGTLMPYPFNTGMNQGGVSVTIDNRHLYLTICKPTHGNYVNCDIYYSSYSYGEWSVPEPLGPNINSPNTWESQPSIASDGKTLYFVSDRPGGYGGADIYKSIKNEEDHWGPAINLGPAVNTSGDEFTPFIHTDSQTLYFSSGDRLGDDGVVFPGHMGLGKKDIFYYRFNADPPWTKPRNIGYPINSPEDDIGFFVSTDGQYGYLTSNKLDGVGGWDVYSFELYQEARPERVLFISGELSDENTSAPIREAVVELKNVETKQITRIPIDEETGKYVVALPFKNDYIMTVKSRDHAYETMYLSRRNTKFEIPVKIDVEVKPLVVGATYPLRDIYFATGSDSLTEESKMVIDGFIDFLNDNESVHVAIHGHTDNIGSKESNQLLSDKRALAVMNYLVDNKIRKSRLTYKGFGESRPIAENDTEEGRALNRRTEFVLIRR